ncbi:hypothetical protein HZA97_03705 [Candidatus Woesearchaeota archaeon]|nr:hypothetical protein [Candidatus Woesearchaeota archaeon]
MDTEKLYQILQQTTTVYRKGELVEEKKVGDLVVTEVFGYPHTKEAPCQGYKKVDLIFVDVVVDEQKALTIKEELEKILSSYPQPERLAGGPSYIELSPNCGLEQEGGLRLMALGEALGLWNVMSAKTLGLNDEMALDLAGQGFLMISGYKGAQK